MSDDDLPMISLSSESGQFEVVPQKSQKEVPVSAPEPIRPPAPRPAAPAAEPRKGTELRKPAPAAAAPARAAGDASASRPAAPSVKPATASVPTVSAGGDDEDPEKLLREYADRQKTKMVRLEQQVVEYKKIVAERDSLRAKVDALGK